MTDSDLQQDLWTLYEQEQNQHENEFLEFIEMMEHRSSISRETPCPNCGHKALEPISLSESTCENCNKTFEI